MKRQQSFIAAMTNKVLSAGTLTRPDRLLGFANALSELAPGQPRSGQRQRPRRPRGAAQGHRPDAHQVRHDAELPLRPRDRRLPARGARPVVQGSSSVTSTKTPRWARSCAMRCPPTVRRSTPARRRGMRPRPPGSAPESPSGNADGGINAEGPVRQDRAFCVGTPDRIRTGATALRGRRARPLHNGGMHVYYAGAAGETLAKPLVTHQIPAWAGISLGY